jgi:DNA-binding winged helix-turn-helix (wHTH) protein
MSVIRFGACVLDVDARQLMRDGQTVHVSPKAFELLKTLIEARPKAFSKAELHERIWPETFVTDDSLARLVAEIRAAIGDHARKPQFLRTVHAFGYAFSKIEDAGRGEPARVETTCWLLHEGRAIALTEGDNVIGREPGGCLILDSMRVSRKHARITVRGIAATLEDLGSRNGTVVDGVRIAAPVLLADGDEITIGGFAIKFRVSDEDAATEADNA